MTKLQRVFPNIEKIVRCGAEKIGAFETSEFESLCLSKLKFGQIKSPIEQALFVGFETVKRLSGLQTMEVTVIPNLITKVKVEGAVGIEIVPQYKIENYRIDFAVRYRRFVAMENYRVLERMVLVECDSQKFHDRTEEERRKEKERDRYLQTKGYKIFHYTGSEILKDPFKICKEIIEFLV